MAIEYFKPIDISAAELAALAGANSATIVKRGNEEKDGKTGHPKRGLAIVTFHYVGGDVEAEFPTTHCSTDDALRECARIANARAQLPTITVEAIPPAPVEDALAPPRRGPGRPPKIAA